MIRDLIAIMYIDASFFLASDLGDVANFLAGVTSPGYCGLGVGPSVP